MPFVIAGGGLLSLDALVANVVAARQESSGAPVDADRRRVLGAVTLAAAAVAVLGAGAAVSSWATSSSVATSSLSDASVVAPTSTPTTTPTSAPTLTPTPSATAATPTPATATPKPKPTPPGGKIGPATAVPVGGSAAFQDPATGDPAIAVQPKGGSFLGFGAVCPHAGCTVGYDQQRVRFVCPCHGSEFNGTTGAVENGPATRGLRRITVAEGSDGQLYAK